MRLLASVLVILMSQVSGGFAVAQEKPPKLTDISILALYQMRGGVIRSDSVAIRIGKAILEDLYGEGFVISQEPFRAKEDNGRWIVQGTSSDPGFEAVIVLSRADSSVVEIDARAPLQ